MKIIILAILLLAPKVGPTTAKKYAQIIYEEAGKRNIHPLLVVSFIHVETATTWRTTVKSTTNDFGLTQVHVAARGSAKFLGREEELFDPRTNIREWCRLADMWYNYHLRSCRGNHPWWAHLKWGYRVKNPDHAMKVTKVFHMLILKFHGEIHQPEV